MMQYDIISVYDDDYLSIFILGTFGTFSHLLLIFVNYYFAEQAKGKAHFAIEII